jgi:alkaline phosphatase D
MTLSRRSFLLAAGSCAALHPALYRAAAADPRFAHYPYTLGVASGYPTPDGVTLWTRLAPQPLEGGGMPPHAVEVHWDVAADAGFRTIVRSGHSIASPEWAHSVHAEVAGLQPGRWYWYRFRAGGAVSPVGKTRTAPAADAPAQRLRFATASCQQYEQGYYNAYRHLAAEDLDLVVFLGDYIYESSWGRNLVRAHGAGEPQTLDEYRARYALYKSDRLLQLAHAAAPWLVTWDDHEVQNDYANDRARIIVPPMVFLERRAAAYRAYYEHMPLPSWARPRGPAMQLHTRAAFGQLAQFHVLDDRQYRSHQPCPKEGYGGSNVVDAAQCAERSDPRLTLLGTAQEQWLADGLARSPARWNIIAQQTMMAQADRTPGEGRTFWTDGWDGYPKARERLLGFIAERRVANPLVLGGDVHMAAVADLKQDFDNTNAPAIATEFVCTSITSQGPSEKRTEALVAENPHIRYANGIRRGYTVFELSPERCTARLRTVSGVGLPGSTIRDAEVYLVDNGRPGAQQA